jgi:S-DNA-T family DNA segregation ATPase FtsK/SpoIIIE
LVGLDPPLPEQIIERWSDDGRTTKALLGWQAGGPFVLDLSMGPHLLIGGTTGAGKSEFLATLVASLAVANRPDAMNFVLIDYKGQHQGL